MTTADALRRTALSRPSGLVSVDGRTYPLKSASLNARAEGGIAATTLSQTYENPYPEALEVLYTLPLPADAAVTGYTIRLGNRVIHGEVRKCEEAREEYRKALLEGRTAALLEQERADTFSQKLGSLPSGEKATVEIEVLQQLAFLPATQSETACWEYRFPTVTGIRYEGAEGRVSDAHKLDVDRASNEMPVRLEAILRIADGPAETTRPWSPDLRLSVQAIEGGAEVAPEKGMSLDRDLVIRWSACKQETGLRVVEGKGLPTDNGRYIMITLTPPSSQSRAILRDLTLLIDASGSMSGQPLEQAKTVAMELLHSLDHGDRFEILAFANEVRPLIAGPVQAGEKSVDRACKELRKLEASGATEMKEAIIKALKPLRPGSQRQVILLSDGYIGFEQEVIGEIWRGLVPGARVHAVGVGSAPNRTLTRGAARAGRGTEIVIGLEEDAKKAAQRLLQATVRPALTDLAVQGSALLSCAPKKPADVFAGRPVLIFAEVKPEGGHLRVSGKAAGESPSWALEIPPLISGSSQGISSTPVAIGALFGREAIEDAEIDLAARNGRSAELDEKIEALGLRHGISSRMTSLIAISENPTVDPRNPRRRERLPVEVPAGVSAEDAGVLPSARLFAMQSMVSGAPALRSRIIKILSRQDALIEKLEQMDMLLNENAMALPPPGLITIKHARALSIDGRNLVFEFEVPVDDFILPGAGTKIRVEFDDSEETGFAAVLENESSKPGPYAAGLTVRLALKLKGRKNDWNHNIGDLSWPGRLKAGRAKVNVNVRIHIQLKVKK